MAVGVVEARRREEWPKTWRSQAHSGCCYTCTLCDLARLSWQEPQTPGGLGSCTPRGSWAFLPVFADAVAVAAYTRAPETFRTYAPSLVRLRASSCCLFGLHTPRVLRVRCTSDQPLLASCSVAYPRAEVPFPSTEQRLPARSPSQQQPRCSRFPILPERQRRFLFEGEIEKKASVLVATMAAPLQSLQVSSPPPLPIHSPNADTTTTTSITTTSRGGSADASHGERRGKLTARARAHAHRPPSSASSSTRGTMTPSPCSRGRATAPSTAPRCAFRTRWS